MDQSSAERREQLLKSIRELESRIAENQAFIEQSGSQFSPGQNPDEIPEEQRKAFKRFRRATDAFAEDRAQLAKLRAKLTQIEQGAGDLERCRQEALRWLNGLTSPDQFLAELELDPSRHPESGPSGPERKVGKRLLALRDGQPGGQLADIDLLRSVSGVDDILISDIVHTGCKRIIAPGPGISPPVVSPTVVSPPVVSPPVVSPPVVSPPVVSHPMVASSVPVVGVLLPVRIETRFDPPSKTPTATWRLRVRIVPDEASIDRHSNLASDFELDSVEAMWREFGRYVDGPAPTLPGPKHPPPEKTAKRYLSGDDPVKKSLWAAFAARHGVPRAAWLAREFLPIADASGIHIQRPAERSGDPDFGRVAGFPKTIELWMGRGGEPASLVTQMMVDTSKLILDFPDLDSKDEKESERWWTSWKIALEVHLGVEIDLGPGEPTDIDVLYAVGLGTDDPVDLFRDHRDAGVLGFLKPGTPTNTISGKAAADLAGDPESWRQVLTADSQNDDAGILSEALTGDPRALIPAPGIELSNRKLDQSMMQLLCPLFWIQTLKTIWGIKAESSEVVSWAVENVFPIGPVPSIRIGEQPYGILPATSIEKWQRSANDRDLGTGNLEKLRDTLIGLRREWSFAAQRTGTIYGADTERLLRLLGRNPVSKTYAYRLFESLELLQAFDPDLARRVRLTPATTATGGDLEGLQGWWDSISAAAINFIGIPQRRYWTMGWPVDLKVPLVIPQGATLEDTVRQLVDEFERQPNIWFDADVPNSLLTTLTRLSILVTAAAAPRNHSTALASRFKLESVARDIPRSNLESLAREFITQKMSDELFKSVCKAAKEIIASPAEDIERSLLATLDSFSYRIDPWITAYAWQRLSSYHTPNAEWQLGIYGWVDCPRPGGGAGPQEFILAPSDAQALAAVVLRDRAINDPQSGRWDMNLESNTVRKAKMLAEQIRAGLHPTEALGSEVERIVGERAVIDKLRRAFPIREEHEGRRVCDGLAILAALSGESKPNADQAAAIGSIASQPKDQIHSLLGTIDAYADMLMAEAVYYVVTSRAERAGAVMDAAVGLASPPEVEVLDSPAIGRNVSTSVLVALSVPDPTAPDQTRIEEEASPGLLADAAVARFLEEVLGPSNGPSWRWEVDTPHSPPIRVTVSLADLKLLPIDAAMISEEQLTRLILDVNPGSRLADPVTSVGPVTHGHASRMINMLAARPALPGDFLEPGKELPGETELNKEVAAELKMRYANLHAAATSLYDNELNHPQGMNPKDVLRHALRWGISPFVNPNESEGGAQAVARAALEMRDRLGSLPHPTDLNEDATVSVQEIASRISRLASSEGSMPVLARFSLAGNPSSFQEAPELDQEWLTVVAPVRSSIARVEAFQLDAILRTSPLDEVIKQNWRPLAAMTNHKDDPWQKRAPAADATMPDGKFEPPSKLICVYGARAAIDNAIRHKTMAFGLLDTWAEVVPGDKSQVAVAFRFNAPRARAPQAILLAVPPNEQEPMSTETLIRILEETRELARARMASSDELHRFSAALPVTMLPFYDGIPTDL